MEETIEKRHRGGVLGQEAPPGLERPVAGHPEEALFEQAEVRGPNEVWLYPSVEAEAQWLGSRNERRVPSRGVITS